jgi:hypothetical protein
VLSTAAASGRSILVLEKTEFGCARRVQVLAIRGREVAAWEMGDCQTQARVTASGDGVAIDFPGACDAKSYAYRDARMFRADLAALSSPPMPDGAAAGATGTPPGRRYVPGPPVVSKAQPPIGAGDSRDRTAARPAAMPAPVSRSKPSDFPVQEPVVRITLDQ